MLCSFLFAVFDALIQLNFYNRYRICNEVVKFYIHKINRL